MYLAPDLAYFGDINTNPTNNFRIYGTILLFVLVVLVAVGVKFVQFFAPVALFCVIVSVICCFIGGFEASERTRDIW